jgi:hypothetical protein
MIALYKSNRAQRRTKDGRRLRRHERQLIVSRFFVASVATSSPGSLGSLPHYTLRICAAGGLMHAGQGMFRYVLSIRKFWSFAPEHFRQLLFLTDL